MEHSFDIEIAKKYGVHSAIILNNLLFWIKKNIANEEHIYDNNCWTYNTRKAFNELFPYMTERQINYALDKLIEDGIIVTGNYNEDKRDRTLWYAITEKGYNLLGICNLHFTKMSNAENTNVTAIPNITNTDNKENICINTNTKEIEILDYLNEKAGTRYRAVESNLRLIRGRLKDYTVDELKKVVDNKVRDWKGTSMQQYLRPETLFGATKIETYLNGLAPTCVEDKKSGNKIGFDGQREYAQEEFNDLCADIDNISLDDM